MVARPQDQVGVHGVQPGVVLVEAEVAAAVSAGPVFDWDIKTWCFVFWRKISLVPL